MESRTGLSQPTAAETPTERQHNTRQVNGKTEHKSAAQKKREKRKQKRREGSVVSDTESVPAHFHQVATLSNRVVQIASSVTIGRTKDFDTVSERSTSLLDTIDTDIDTDNPVYAAFRKVFNRRRSRQQYHQRRPRKG